MVGRFQPAENQHHRIRLPCWKERSYLVAVQSAFVGCSAAWTAPAVLLGRTAHHHNLRHKGEIREHTSNHQPPGRRPHECLAGAGVTRVIQTRRPCGRTSHSSRRRFAARLHSGVLRHVNGTCRTFWVKNERK
jgi:hypothetical protein